MRCRFVIGVNDYLDENDVGSGFGEGYGHLLANTARATGDQGSSSLKRKEVHCVDVFGSIFIASYAVDRLYIMARP